MITLMLKSWKPTSGNVQALWDWLASMRRLVNQQRLGEKALGLPSRVFRRRLRVLPHNEIIAPLSQDEVVARVLSHIYSDGYSGAHHSIINGGSNHAWSLSTMVNAVFNEGTDGITSDKTSSPVYKRPCSCSQWCFVHICLLLRPIPRAGGAHLQSHVQSLTVQLVK